LPVARQISNGEGLFVLTVNQLCRLAVIHGPYTSRSMPLQTVPLSLVTATPHPSVAAKKICQDTSLLVGKEVAQGWKPDCRTAYPVKELNHLLPLLDRSTVGRATAQLGLVLR
jgi:hypothetical protein